MSGSRPDATTLAEVFRTSLGLGRVPPIVVVVLAAVGGQVIGSVGAT